MRVNDPGKLLVLLAAVIGAVVLLAMGAISESAGVGIITAAIGYVAGNGRLAARGDQPTPTIAPREPAGPTRWWTSRPEASLPHEAAGGSDPGRPAPPVPPPHQPGDQGLGDG